MTVGQSNVLEAVKSLGLMVVKGPLTLKHQEYPEGIALRENSYAVFPKGTRIHSFPWTWSRGVATMVVPVEGYTFYWCGELREDSIIFEPSLLQYTGEIYPGEEVLRGLMKPLGIEPVEVALPEKTTTLAIPEWVVGDDVDTRRMFISEAREAAEKFSAKLAV